MFKIRIQILINKSYILHYINNITLLTNKLNILNYGFKVMKNIKMIKNFYKILAALKLYQEKQKLHIEDRAPRQPLIH